MNPRAAVRVLPLWRCGETAARDRKAERGVELLERRLAEVGVDLDQVDAFAIADGDADHALKAVADEQVALGRVALGIVEPGDERAAAGADDRLGRRIVAELVGLVLEVARGDPDPGSPPLAVVAEGRVAEPGLAGGTVRDRPASEVAGGRERGRDDLEAVQGRGLGELGVEGPRDLLRRLPEPRPKAAVGDRHPLALALGGDLGGGADPISAAPLCQVLGGVGGGEELRGGRHVRRRHRDPAGDGERIVGSLREQALGAVGDLGDRRVAALDPIARAALEQDAELVAADPAHERPGKAAAERTRALATRRSATSPAAWPLVSLIIFRRSRSQSMIESSAAPAA